MKWDDVKAWNYDYYIRSLDSFVRQKPALRHIRLTEYE